MHKKNSGVQDDGDMMGDGDQDQGDGRKEEEQLKIPEEDDSEVKKS